MTMVSVRHVVSFMLPSGERVEERVPSMPTFHDRYVKWRRDTGEVVMVPWTRVLLIISDEVHVMTEHEMESLRGDLATA